MKSNLDILKRLGELTSQLNTLSLNNIDDRDVYENIEEKGEIIQDYISILYERLLEEYSMDDRFQK